MIAVILAGGFATRLYLVTREMAKPLLPLAGRPVIDHIMERVGELEAVDRTVITTNAKFEPQFTEWLDSRSYKNVVVRVERALTEQEKPGAIRALFQLLPALASDALIVAGDNIFTSSLEGMVEIFRLRNAPVVAVYDVGDPRRANRFSTVKVDDDDRVVSFEEKPREPASSLIGTCIYLLPNRSLRRIGEYLDEGGNRDSPGHFMSWLCENEAVYGYVLQGYWCDVGTPEAYEDARRKLQEANST